MSRKLFILVSYVVSLLFGLNLNAYAQDPAFETLMNNSSFECRFLVGRSATITEFGKAVEVKKDGTIIISKGKWNINKKVDEGFPSITFRQIERIGIYSLKALMSGNTGITSQVAGYIGAGYMTFIESKEMGGIAATTIFAEFDSQNELISVHSRHSKVFSKVIASQYYGSCRPIAP